jgi:hypothetical protein
VHWEKLKARQWMMEFSYNKFLCCELCYKRASLSWMLSCLSIFNLSELILWKPTQAQLGITIQSNQQQTMPQPHIIFASFSPLPLNLNYVPPERDIKYMKVNFIVLLLFRCHCCFGFKFKYFIKSSGAHFPARARPIAEFYVCLSRLRH